MKILIIEDDPEIASALKDGLSQKSYTVLCLDTYAAGLRKAAHEQFDLFIIDWTLPDGDGVELCRQLRKSGIHTPVLVLTAKDQTQDIVAGLEAGADDYLTKPFAFSELFARIRSLTRRQPQLLNQEFRLTDLKVNLTTMEVTRANQSIQLAPKEYELLEYLIKNKNQVLDKYQILDRLWLHESDVAVNTVEVFIGYLRNKIDRAFPDSAPLIHTIRGKGYLFGERSNNV